MTLNSLVTDTLCRQMRHNGPPFASTKKYFSVHSSQNRRFSSPIFLLGAMGVSRRALKSFRNAHPSRDSTSLRFSCDCDSSANSQIITGNDSRTASRGALTVSTLRSLRRHGDFRGQRTHLFARFECEHSVILTLGSPCFPYFCQWRIPSRRTSGSFCDDARAVQSTSTLSRDFAMIVSAFRDELEEEA